MEQKMKFPLRHLQPVKNGHPKIIGLIAGDTFGSRGNSHLADMKGNVVCGTKNRFGMDCTSEIRIYTYEHFETDQTEKFNADGHFDFNTNHLPMDQYISCKKCQNKIKKVLNPNTMSNEELLKAIVWYLFKMYIFVTT